MYLFGGSVPGDDFVTGRQPMPAHTPIIGFAGFAGVGGCLWGREAGRGCVGKEKRG